MALWCLGNQGQFSAKPAFNRLSEPICELLGLNLKWLLTGKGVKTIDELHALIVASVKPDLTAEEQLLLDIFRELDQVSRRRLLGEAHLLIGGFTKGSPSVAREPSSVTAGGPAKKGA